MSISFVGNPTYSTLQSYAVLSENGISSAGLTTINNGYYGGNLAQIVGNYAASGTPQGLDTANVPSAVNELLTLIGSINSLTPTNSTYTGGNGTVVLTPGVYSTTGDMVFGDVVSTTIVFDAQNDPSAQFFLIATTGAIKFDNMTAMTLVNGALAANIFWMADAISFFNIPPPTSYGILIAIGGFVLFSSTLTVDGSIYNIGKDPVEFNGNSVVNGVNGLPICYVKGTKILTQNGYVAIEDITVGDSIATIGKIVDGAVILHEDIVYKPAIWIGKFTIRNMTLESSPVCIKQGALGKRRPFEELRVSPIHALVVGGTLTLARDLLNGRTVVQDYASDEVVYYHLEVDGHSCIFANGLLAESYLDNGNRGIFENKHANKNELDA